MERRGIIKCSAQMVISGGMLDDVKAKLRFHFHYKLTIGCPQLGCAGADVNFSWKNLSCVWERVVRVYSTMCCSGSCFFCYIVFS